MSDYFHDYTMCFIIYHARDIVWYVIVKQRITTELINLPIDSQFICSMNMKGKCVETLFQILLLL